MKKLFILTISCILLARSLSQDTNSSTNAPVISRNDRIQEMIDGLNIQNNYYSEIMENTNYALEEQNEECKKKINEMNCSNVEVWENLRRKHSKNITNLQDKMKKHNETIQQILKVNKELVEKKNSSLMQLFPEVKKLKNDQEMIDIMLMIIDDTYVRVEDMDLEASETNSTAAVFILSELEKELQKMGKFVQIKRREGPPPPSSQDTNETQLDENTTVIENVTETEVVENVTETEVVENVTETEVVENETGETETEVVENATGGTGEQTEETNETSNEDVPLIDEEIFDKGSQGNQTEEEDLFGPGQDEEIEEEAPLVADEIPEGKDVKEHDEDHLEKISRPAATGQNKSQPVVIEHYELKQLKMSLKQRIKQQGREMFKELSFLRKELKMEQESKLEQISAYERAIYLIHQKHMHEIIQIYKENRRLYIQILEKDDAVMQLDSKINECRNIQEYEQSCEDVKDSLSQFAEDSKSQINFNNAAIKELEKLIEYEDKNVFDPAQDGSQPEEANQSSVAPQGPMHYYEDYGQTDDGQLVKRTIVCKVTECRQKHVTSQQQFQLLLKKKYDQLNEDQLLKETQQQEEKGTELDQRFEIKERSVDDTESDMPEEEQLAAPVETYKQQVQNVVTPVAEELTPINDENIISEMKDKLDSDVGGGKIEEQKEEPQQLQQQAPAKSKKQRVLNKKHSEAKLGEIPETKTKKVHLRKKNTEQELTEPKPVENEEKQDSNIFSQALHYLFGSKNAQTFTEIRETHSNGPLDLLAQFN